MVSKNCLGLGTFGIMMKNIFIKFFFTWSHDSLGIDNGAFLDFIDS